eukprot:Skav211789  [mRNA]  locus=scaffold305:193009:195168:+ [translate_table: standard]
MNPRGLGEKSSPRLEEVSEGLCLAVAALACGCSFYGLSYSAGQLSPDAYSSTAFLSLADVLGYSLALSADYWGRTRVQGVSFGLAAFCLFLCSAGEPGTSWVIAFAMVGRLCLDLCCSTVLAALAASSQTAQKTMLPACETSARLGATFAPFLGTFPTAVSCKIFGALCLAAAWATWALGSPTPRRTMR